MSHALISLSVVSHGHRRHLAPLLADLAALGRTDLELILTVNIPEALDDLLRDLPFPVRVIENSAPKGFGANHNAALGHACGAWFVVLNPDIRLIGDPFDALLQASGLQPPAIVAPMIVNDLRQPEDSARHFPVWWHPFKRFLARSMGIALVNDAVRVEGDIAYPDWVAGMFMMLPLSMAQRLGGFNERYRMYYEDVELCARARLAGYEVRVARTAPVIHNAQRDSHRRIRPLLWHVRSALRFFLSPTYRAVRRRRPAGH